MVGGSRIAFVVKHLILALILLIVMFPVYWLVSMSFKNTRELSALPPTMIVQNFTLQNFYNVLVTQNFAQYAWNSLMVAVIATLIATIAGSLCAYGLSRFRLPKNLNYQLLFTVLTVRMFPPSVTVIPIYILFNQQILGFRLYDTQFGLGLVRFRAISRKPHWSTATAGWARSAARSCPSPRRAWPPPPSWWRSRHGTSSCLR